MTLKTVAGPAKLEKVTYGVLQGEGSELIIGRSEMKILGIPTPEAVAAAPVQPTFDAGNSAQSCLRWTHPGRHGGDPNGFRRRQQREIVSVGRTRDS